MDNDYVGYASERVMAALSALATHPGRIQERLGLAVRELSVLQMDRLPDSIRGILLNIYDTCTKPKSGENSPGARAKGTIVAACDELNDAEASQIATLIFRTYDDIEGLMRG